MIIYSKPLLGLDRTISFKIKFVEIIVIQDFWRLDVF